MCLCYLLTAKTAWQLVNRKADFFTKRIDSNRFAQRIESNRFESRIGMLCTWRPSVCRIQPPKCAAFSLGHSSPHPAHSLPCELDCRPSTLANRAGSIQLVDSLRSSLTIIIYLLKSTEQEDAHMINTRTRAGQERHRKLALTICP